MVARPRAAVSRFSSEPTPTAFAAPLLASLSSANSALQATPTRVRGHDQVQHVYRGAAQLVEPREEAELTPRTRKRTRDRGAARRFQRVKRDDLGWTTTDTRHLERRQWQLPHAEGYPNCNYQDNSVFTCYPQSNTTLVQGDYSLVIWNAMQPSFITQQQVDIYLCNADTQDVATSWKNEQNAQGMIGIVPDDPWWPGPQSAEEWFGENASNRTTPYYFVVVPAGSSLTGGEVHGATFRAIQTAAPSSLSSTLAVMTSSSLSSVSSLSSLASASSASSASLASRSAASASSLSAASATASYPSGSNRNTGSGSLQNDHSSDPTVPNWGIALIVIFGVLALVAGGLAVFLCLGRARRKRRQQEEEEAAAAAAATGVGAGVGAGLGAGLGARARTASSVGGGGEYVDDDDHTQGSSDPILGGGTGGTMRSTASLAPAFGAAAAARLATGQEEGTGGTLLSTSDAARMAEAFRAALRKSPFHLGGGGAAAAATGTAAAATGAAVASSSSRRPPGPSPTGGIEKGQHSHGSGSGSNNHNNGDDDEGTVDTSSSSAAGGIGRELLVNELQGEGRSMKSVEGGGGKRWGGFGGSGGGGGGAGSGA